MSMDTKSTSIHPAPDAAPKPRRRRPRAPEDTALITGSGTDALLAHEDSDQFQALRDSFRQRANAQSPADIALAELAACAAWRALRCITLEVAAIDLEITNQQEERDAEYEWLADAGRTVLTFQNPDLARIVRQVGRAQYESQRALLQLLRFSSGRAPA